MVGKTTSRVVKEVNEYSTGFRFEAGKTNRRVAFLNGCNCRVHGLPCC